MAGMKRCSNAELEPHPHAHGTHTNGPLIYTVRRYFWFLGLQRSKRFCMGSQYAVGPHVVFFCLYSIAPYELLLQTDQNLASA